ncbi:MAG: hypothetical protein ACR2JV_08335 [Gaiellales bacterium]
MAPIRQVAPGGGVELEVDPPTGHVAWRVAGRRSGVARARAVAGDAAVDRILRETIAQLRAQAAEGGEDRVELRDLAGRLWRTRHGDAPAGEPQSRLF